VAKNGLFVGMVTLDLVYQTPHFPDSNEKIAASDYTVAAGGPATNAAVTFNYLGDRATILGVVGTHPITQLIRSDLDEQGVTVTDLEPSLAEPPPVSSIISTQGTGNRAVISLNAKKIQASCDRIPEGILAGVDLVLIDGHQMEASVAIAQLAKTEKIPVVIDGGSWKPGFEKVLPFVDYAVCSANFFPPGCSNREAVFTYLEDAGIPHIAVTRGEKPIQYLSKGESGQLDVPSIQPVDTLGAGDVFHGAFCHYILRENFTQALESAAKIAAHSCQFFGTRQWMAPPSNVGSSVS
jgi:sugar/nucleoside kinase (ribokinase family)